MAPRILAQSCCTTPAAMCYWAAAFVLVYGAGLLLTAIWPDLEAYGDMMLLLAFGAACFLNFRQNTQTANHKLTDASGAAGLLLPGHVGVIKSPNKMDRFGDCGHPGGFALTNPPFAPTTNY